MNKRGDFPGLEDIVKYTIYAVPFILVLAFFIALPKYIFPERSTAEILNRDAVADKLASLDKTDFLEVPVQIGPKAEDYAIVLYADDSKNLPIECNKKACVCIEKGSVKDCEIVALSACAENKKQCIKSSYWIVKKEEVKPIPICSTEGKVALGSGCTAVSLS